MTKLFVPLVILSEVLGLAACVLLGVWMGRYGGGFAWDGSGLEFNLHPLLMTTAMIFLYGNGILTYRVFTGINLPRIAVKATHAGILLLATVMLTVGLVAVFQFHSVNHYGHLDSLHSWLGLATVILFVLQFVLGFGIFLLPFAPSQLRAAYLSSHVFFGIAILCLAAATCLIGTVEKIMFSAHDPTVPPEATLVARVASLCIVAFVVTVVYILTTDKAATNRSSNNYTPINH